MRLRNSRVLLDKHTAIAHTPGNTFAVKALQQRNSYPPRSMERFPQLTDTGGASIRDEAHYGFPRLGEYFTSHDQIRPNFNSVALVDKITERFLTIGIWCELTSRWRIKRFLPQSRENLFSAWLQAGRQAGPM